MAPRGIRNNNPGNIRNSDATDWKGEIPAGAKKDNSFEEFKDMPHGYRALIRLLQNYRRKHGCQTIADFIVPDVDDKGTMCALAAAISQVENGIPAVMADVEAGWELLNE